MADLFLSHVEEDSLLVQELGDALEAEGYSIWNYKRDARPVIDHRTQTRNAIAEAAGFVLLISPRSLENSLHVGREVSRAAELGKPFVPLLLDVPFAEFAERQPTWEEALAGAVAIRIPPEGPAGIVPAIAGSLRELGVKPSIPTALLEERRRPAPETAPGSHVASTFDLALSYFDRDFLIATELADALEAEGYSIWYYDRDVLRGKPPDRTPFASTSPAGACSEEAGAVAELTAQLVEDAVNRGGTEIQIEPHEADSLIRIRTDGVLQEFMRVPKQIHEGLIDQLRALSDAVHQVRTEPTAYGESAVVNLFDGDAVQRAIGQAAALVMIVRRDPAGVPRFPPGLPTSGALGKPLLLVELGMGTPVAGPDELAWPAPTGSVILEMPAGVSGPCMATLLGRLQDMGIRPRHRTMRIQLVLGDITEQKVDAIVNAANSTLMGGGGVDGEIHHRGGPQILQECKQIRRERYPEGLPTGAAVATSGGRLPAAWVIHTVGPVFSHTEDGSRLLASCHTEALRVADELGAKSVAFPAISTGTFGYPVALAAPVAVKAVKDATTRVEQVRFVLFDRAAYEAFERALRAAD